MASAISIRNLSKKFARARALENVSFDVPEGSLFGLLGPNGAGKTTLFSIAAGFLTATSGTIEVLGIDVREISRLRGRFAMLPQDAAFQAGIPVIEQLVMFARLNGYDAVEARNRAQRALEMVDLGEVGRRSARALSHGQAKRVALCQAFLGEPEVLLLDEPTSGLDPETARRMRDLVRELTKTKTVVISSHNLREIQEICTHAAILHKGKLEVAASMEELTGANFLVRIVLASPLTDAAEASLRALPGVRALQRTGPTEINLELDVAAGGGKDPLLKSINRVLLIDHDLSVRSLHEGASLEARFLEITGGTYDGASST
jgi:ABC-2 type transport system ATP-binding protein